MNLRWTIQSIDKNNKIQLFNEQWIENTQSFKKQHDFKHPIRFFFLNITFRQILHYDYYDTIKNVVEKTLNFNNL